MNEKDVFIYLLRCKSAVTGKILFLNSFEQTQWKFVKKQNIALILVQEVLLMQLSYRKFSSNLVEKREFKINQIHFGK